MNEQLRIAICEDNPADMELLFSCITESNMNIHPDRFFSGEDLLTEFLPGKYDVIFLDIYMSGMCGIDTAAKIRKTDRNVTLAFTTTSTEHTLESYRLKAASYLEKPVRQEDVREILSHALVKRNTVANITLLVKGKNRSLPVDGIIYFELKNHAVQIFTHTETLRVSQSVKLDHIEPMLPGYYFRCHHSYIVNLRCVKDIDRELAVFIMSNNNRVHIRRRDINNALKVYESFLFAAARGENI